MHALVICEPWQVSERLKAMGYIVLSLSLEACCWETSEGWRGLSCALTGNLELFSLPRPTKPSHVTTGQPEENLCLSGDRGLCCTRTKALVVTLFSSLSARSWPIHDHKGHLFSVDGEGSVPPTESPLPHPNTWLWPCWASTSTWIYPEYRCRKSL